MSVYKDLKDKIRNKKAVITVVGLGYVGLPMALEFEKKGFKVNGLDADNGRIRILKKGCSYINDLSHKSVEKAVNKGKFSVTTSNSVLGKSDVIIVCVPTPLGKTHEPDLSFVIDVSKTLKKYVRKGQGIIFESTTYPGTTKEVILPILEKSGFKAGKDFFLAFSPERIDPGNPKYDFTNIPKLVGGITKNCTGIAKSLYSHVVKRIIPLSSTETAEVTKLLENTFRIVNIGLINEFAHLCHKLDIDVWEVIKAASTKPFGFMPFYPGPGVGGHCIPADPLYLSWKAKRVGFETKMIDLAAKVNRNVPSHVIERIQDILSKYGKKIKDANILIVGVTFKKDVNDLRDSPALDIMDRLHKGKAKLTYHDPYISEITIKKDRIKSSKLSETFLKKQDIVVVVTDHGDVDYKKISDCSKIIFDTRNVFEKNKIKTKNIIKL